MVILGIEDVDYVSKKTGKRVTGYNLHLTYESSKVEGLATLKEYVSKEIGQNVEVNDEVELLYNKFGQVTQIVHL